MAADEAYGCRKTVKKEQPRGVAALFADQIILLLSVRSLRSSCHDVHHCDQDHKTYQQGQEHVLGQTRYDVGKCRDSCAGHRVRELRGNMVQVVALCARRRHDSRIGDG